MTQIWLLCIIFLGRIYSRVLKNVVVVEYGLNIGVEKISEIVSSNSFFEYTIDDKLEGGGGCVFGIKYGK